MLRLLIMKNKPKPSRYCEFEGCKNNSLMKGIHFYRFPKNESRCLEWIYATNNKRLLHIPLAKLAANSSLCSEHFEDWCFMNSNSKHRLVHNAVPNSPKPLVSIEHSDILEQLILSLIPESVLDKIEDMKQENPS